MYFKNEKKIEKEGRGEKDKKKAHGIVSVGKIEQKKIKIKELANIA